MSKLRASTFCCAFSERFIDPRVDNRFVLLEAETLKHRVHALRSENAHEIVLQGQEEFRPAGIPLATRSAAQLVIDAPAFVPLGADNVEPASVDRLLLEGSNFRPDRGLMSFALLPGRRDQFPAYPHLDIAAELNVGAATRHIGCDRDRAGDPRFFNDKGFLLLVTSVQNRKFFEGLPARAAA